MYSIFFSKIELGIDSIREDLKKLISKDAKVVILPWAFPVEIDSETLMNSYFKKGQKRYLKYINALEKIGIQEKNIIIGDCYKDSTQKLKEMIESSDVLVLPGGNPEMFFQKVLHDTEIFYTIKHFKGIIIGESAGTLLQFKRYFISKRNNFYNTFAYYDGFGVIENDFYIDVHSINNTFYQKRLQAEANKLNKKIYCLYDDGAILLNRSTKKIKIYGPIKIVTKENQ